MLILSIFKNVLKNIYKSKLKIIIDFINKIIELEKHIIVIVCSNDIENSKYRKKLETELVIIQS